MSIKREKETKKKSKNPDKIIYNVDNIKGKAHKTWYRGEHCNFNPNISNLKQKDSIYKYIIKGWEPHQKFINKKTKVAAFGSCFAREISKYLVNKGYNFLAPGIKNDNILSQNEILDFKAGVNNTFALSQLFNWVINDISFDEELWHDQNKKIIKQNKDIRLTTLEEFKKVDVFIITLGLSEVWYNKETGGVFWRAVPTDNFDSKIHGFKVASFKENKENIKFIYNSIKSINKNSKIIFTISPVPLVATFRPITSISANSVSKALLRGAIDEFYREIDNPSKNGLYYWPSYEMVKELFPYTYKGSAYKNDNRHIKDSCIKEIMKNFELFYVQDDNNTRKFNYFSLFKGFKL
jgi:hypothetical protein